jgi:uncharacterized protein DUF6190
MPEPAPFVDASVFLGMHHQDDLIRQRSLGFFRSYFTAPVRMNLEQVGMCDAVIWRESREVQDLYYPFMDRLQSDMQIVREGYSTRELDLAVGHRELQGLRPEQALLAAQVLTREGALVTHDPVLRRLRCLQSHLWGFESARADAGFPPKLQALYETSCAFVYAAPE